MPYGTAIGTGIGAYFGGPKGAAYGAAAGAMLDGAFSGGGSYRSRNRDMRKQYEYAERYQNRVIKANNIANIKGIKQGAREAGLHPLFAMGASPGSSPSFSSSGAGQSQSGSVSNDAILSLLGGMAELNSRESIADKQLAMAALRIADNNTSNDSAQVATTSAQEKAIDPALQEFKKGDVQAHVPGKREQSTREMSPWTKVRMGSQDVWIPTEEVDTIMEDPLMVGLTTVGYQGNKNVDWALLWREYRGYKDPTKRNRRKIRGRDVRRRKYTLKAKPPKYSKSYGQRGHGYRPRVWTGVE